MLLGEKGTVPLQGGVLALTWGQEWVQTLAGARWRLWVSTAVLT